MALADNYTVATGLSIYGGRASSAVNSDTPSPYQFNINNITIDERTGDANPYSTYFANQITAQNTSKGRKMPLVMVVHGSSGSGWSNGRMYTTPVDGAMAFPEDADFKFGLVVTAANSVYSVELRPVDVYTGAGALGESSHQGFVRPDGKYHLISEHRYDALLDWVDSPTNTDMSKYDLRRRVITGGSMGGWGSISYGVRRYTKFAAIYPDRPRWHYSGTVGKVGLTVWGNGKTDFSSDATPFLADDPTVRSDTYINMTAYVANAANKVRWIGWCVGRADGFSIFQDHVLAVTALRSAKRGFAFAWNNGDHTTGSIMSQITQSYPIGTFSMDQGYPLFTSHSLDQDPAVDLVGGINIGLSFRNVIETANGWTCEVTNILNACSVDIEPISDAFTKVVSKKNMIIPAANTWVSISFS